MTQAITVKLLPVTNAKPSRWKATCEAGSVTHPVQFTNAGSSRQLV